MKDSEFTGERYVPGQGGFQIAYEHLHRYLFASQLARGRTVLDVACGSGYGSALLAREASLVIALDVELSVLKSVPLGTAGHNLQLLAADAMSLPVRDRTIDFATAFEVIEHVADAELLVHELSRVIRPDGLLIISTPNKATYSDARDYRNPFHLQEFYREEFLELLRKYFMEVRLLVQQVRAGSYIEGGADCCGVADVRTQPLPDPSRNRVEPMYFLAACSPARGGVDLPVASVFLDPSDGLLAEWDERLSASLREIERLNGEIRRLGDWAGVQQREIEQRDELLRETMHGHQLEVGGRDETIRVLQREMAEEIARRDRAIGELNVELESRLAWVRSLEQEVSGRDETIRKTYRELEQVGRHLATIRQAFLYRVLRRLGLLPD